MEKFSKRIVRDQIPTVVEGSDVALDIEMFEQTDGKLHRPTGHFASIQLYFGGDEVYVITSEHRLPELFEELNKCRYWIGHNLMYDIRQLRRWVDIHPRKVWDTMIVETLLWGGYYPGGRGISLHALVRRYFDISLDKKTRDAFKTATKLTDKMIRYGCEDSYWTYEVFNRQNEIIEERQYDMRTYWEIDEPSIWVFLDIRPMKVDVSRWMVMAEEFERRGREIEQELGINVNSPPQVKTFIKKHYKKELKSTAKEILAEIGGDLIDKILLARRYRKATSTYGQKWIDKNVEDGDYVYSDYYINGTETGRPSSSSPNLLNIPARQIPEYRELFIASYNGKMIVADISQQEPRILASLADAKNLKAVFSEGKDVHLMVTRAAYMDDTIKKSDPRRDTGKMINLATSYGMTAQGLAKKLGIPEEQAETFLNSYFGKYPGVYAYLHSQRDKVGRFGFAETITGRRIWINQHNYQWSNNAINAPIQGSAADFTKLWMIKIWEKCREQDIPFTLSNCVYDEVILDVPEAMLGVYKKIVSDSFDETAEYLFPDVPFEIEMETGSNWRCKQLKEEE